ncbi:NUDIX hydrolase [Candidatus Beckwithbacteria bacterium]|nr:NUDIX hydrolase [Candidatus Beckwithbacteria bacterium]
MFKILKTKKVYETKFITVFEDEIEFPSGQKGIYNFIARKNGVAILASDSQDRILLLKQYRYPIKDFSWSLPAGSIDDNENLESAAVREFKEETGFEISSLQKINIFYPLDSCTAETSTLFFWQD